MDLLKRSVTKKLSSTIIKTGMLRSFHQESLNNDLPVHDRRDSSLLREPPRVLQLVKQTSN